jgi:hypothetical protein
MTPAQREIALNDSQERAIGAILDRAPSLGYTGAHHIVKTLVADVRRILDADAIASAEIISLRSRARKNALIAANRRKKLS